VIGNWPNTYTFTKAVAEDMIKEEARGLPVGILRPSIGKYNTSKGHFYILKVAFRRSN
jgi:nucleoside-diphosphate-sugar epimerase